VRCALANMLVRPWAVGDFGPEGVAAQVEHPLRRDAGQLLGELLGAGCSDAPARHNWSGEHFLIPLLSHRGIFLLFPKKEEEFGTYSVCEQPAPVLSGLTSCSLSHWTIRQCLGDAQQPVASRPGSSRQGACPQVAGAAQSASHLAYGPVLYVANAANATNNGSAGKRQVELEQRRGAIAMAVGEKKQVLVSPQSSSRPFMAGVGYTRGSPRWDWDYRHQPRIWHLGPG
jgi:hypothetical protein